MSICDWLEIEWPVIQAPMAGSQGSALAIAVANAGGLGSQPCVDAAPPFPLAATAIFPLRQKAEGAGVNDFTPMWGGQNAAAGREQPAAELTRALGEALGAGRRS